MAPVEERLSTGENAPFMQRIREFTPMVLFMTFYLALTAWNFGYDVSVFAGVQAMKPFVERFGDYNASTGKYAIPSYVTSIMNSFPYLGKLIGCWAATPIAEKLGRKRAVLTIALCSFIGVILQISATTTAQLTIGRCICYGMTGIVALVMPAFMAECAPRVLRGMVGTQLQLQIVVAQVVASAVNYGTSMNTTNAGWRTSLGIQFIMPGLLLVFYPLIVESPRWLLSQNRPDEAAAALRRLRKKHVSEELIQNEVSILGHSVGNVDKGKWQEIFQGTNSRRTAIACIVMVGQQITGQAFVSQYSVLFYKSEGFSNSFQLGMIQQCLGLIAAICLSLVVDSFGRRIVLIFGGIMCSIFLFILGAMGSLANPSTTESRLLVASVQLWFFFYILSWASLPYVIIGETATRRLVEKTNMLAVSLSVLCAFLVSFTVPYLIDPGYGNLGGKVGFVYGSLQLLFTALTFLFVPEMKARSLEEIDALFAKKTPTRKFKNTAVASTDPDAAVAPEVERDVKDKTVDGKDESTVVQVEAAPKV